MIVPDKQWYLLYCKSGNETRAQANLENQGITSFFPLFNKEKLRKGKKRASQEPLFPNYLFVYLDVAEANFNAIRSTRGVIDFVKAGANYVRVPDNVIHSLQASQQNFSYTEQLFQQGQELEVLRGPFAGLTGIFQCEDGLERSILMIRLLSSQQKVSVDNKDLNSN